MRIFWLVFTVFLLHSCGSEETNNTQPVQQEGASSNGTGLLTLLSSAETGIDFKNVLQESPERHVGLYSYFYTGGGVASGDFNKDGLPDLFFTGNDVGNQLYLNKGDLKFDNITEQAGVGSSGRWSGGVTLVDINEDGWLDLYVCNSGPSSNPSDLANQLFVNNQDNTFTERAAEYGIDDNSYSTQATFFDMDRDGDLDLFVMNHALRNIGRSQGDWLDKYASLDAELRQRMRNTLYRNDGGHFTDITKTAGVDEVGFGLGLSVFDANDDGWLDIFVANDYFIPDFLFMNKKDGTFEERARGKFPHISYYSMGCDAADFNNDGLIDLGVLDMTPSDHYRNKTLMASMDVDGFKLLTEALGYAPQYMFNAVHLNRGGGIFSEIANMTGAAQTDWSWAALFVDLDNDGWKDFLVSNGYLRDTKDNDWKIAVEERQAQGNFTADDYFAMIQSATSNPIPNYVLRNQGNLTFQDASTDWGLTAPSFSNGTVYADLDLDGDLEVVFNNLEQEAFVYRNNAVEQGNSNWIQFELEAGPSINQALFAKVKIWTGDQQQQVEYQFTRGYESFMEPMAHFGLGKTTQVDKVEVIWPDGQMTVLNNPPINQRHTIQKTNTQAQPSNNRTRPFANVTPQIPGLQFQHKENAFNDFAKEVLLPHKQSTLGPALAVGDWNKDGLEDIFVGGAMNQASALFMHDEQRYFLPFNQPALAADQGHEDTGALFFDADGDGDQDLYVCSGGGGEMEGNNSLLQDRLYRNDNGRMQKVAGALPPMPTSTMAVTAHDWDNDGDQDLFVGGRTEPGRYPIAPRSYLLQNNNGQFVDVTAQMAPELKNWGMVTDALWMDMNGDQTKELVVVGEWQAIAVFQKDGDQFTDQAASYGLSDSEGWWYSVVSADVDNDGDQDLLVGNIGLNNKFHPKPEKPLMVFGNDFDENGVLDIVLSKYYNGEVVPVRGKECSTEQMPFLADKFPSYASFASSDLETIYGEEKLESAVQLQVTTFASIWVENKGNGQFVQHQLPSEAQIGPINGFVVDDYNRDGFADIILGGGMTQTEVETPRYDAGRGLILWGKGQGEFDTSLDVTESGLFFSGDAKQLLPIAVSRNGVPGVLVANNNWRLNLWLLRDGNVQ